MESISILMILICLRLLLCQITKKIGLPTVVGQLITGIILGGGLFNWVHPNHLISLLAEGGVFSLMWNAGRESDLKIMRQSIRTASMIALGGIPVPAVGLTGTLLILNYPCITALFGGIVFAE